LPTCYHVNLQLTHQVALWQRDALQAILGFMSEQTPQEISDVAGSSTQQPTTEGVSSRLMLFRQWALLPVVAGAVIGLDQTAKGLVTERLMLGQSWAPIPQIAGFLRITRSYNTGAAFGMLPQASGIILLVAIVAIIAFVISYPRLPSNAWLSRFGIAMIVGGAFSNNALDRLRLDHVTDYVHVQLSPTLSNVSNFADHAICVGVVLMLAGQWLHERRGEQAENTKETEKASVNAILPDGLP
jgi:signal peptidase II